MITDTISRRYFLRTIAAGAAAVAMPRVLYGNNLPAKKYNFLFLLADDQRADSIHAYGNNYIQTPNLDKLISRGFSFRQNYCLGSNGGAVCVPSRAMINSGRSYFNVCGFEDVGRQDHAGTAARKRLYHLCDRKMA